MLWKYDIEGNFMYSWEYLGRFHRRLMGECMDYRAESGKGRKRKGQTQQQLLRRPFDTFK